MNNVSGGRKEGVFEYVRAAFWNSGVEGVDAGQAHVDLQKQCNIVMRQRGVAFGNAMFCSGDDALYGLSALDLLMPGAGDAKNAGTGKSRRLRWFDSCGGNISHVVRDYMVH